MPSTATVSPSHITYEAILSSLLTFWLSAMIVFFAMIGAISALGGTWDDYSNYGLVATLVLAVPTYLLVARPAMRAVMRESARRWELDGLESSTEQTAAPSEIERLRALIVEWAEAETGADAVPATTDRTEEWDAAAERFRRAEAALRKEARRD